MALDKDFRGEKDHKSTQDEPENRKGEKKTEHHRNGGCLIEGETVKHGIVPDLGGGHG